VNPPGRQGVPPPLVEEGRWACCQEGHRTKTAARQHAEQIAARQRYTARPHPRLYGDPVNWAAIWAAISAIATLLGSAAIVLAFIQFRAQREDQRRAQISKVGVWTSTVLLEDEPPPDEPTWVATLFIRNASELPIQVHLAELAITEWGSKWIRARAPGEPLRVRADEQTEITQPAFYFPRAIPPGHTWEGTYTGTSQNAGHTPMEPQISIIQIAITDAAGRQWDMRPYRGRPPRRIRWREWRTRAGTIPSPGANRK
jgi:hypothetical protein